MTPALKLAKECGIRDNIHDDAAMDYLSNVRIETFYRRAQAQALRDAAAWDWYLAAAGDHIQRRLNEIAAELENQK